MSKLKDMIDEARFWIGVGPMVLGFLVWPNDFRMKMLEKIEHEHVEPAPKPRDPYAGNQQWATIETVQSFLDEMRVNMVMEFDIRRFAGIHPEPGKKQGMIAQIPVRFTFEAKE